jgi:hypothetical protein
METLGKIAKLFLKFLWKLFLTVVWGLSELLGAILKALSDYLKNHLSKK